MAISQNAAKKAWQTHLLSNAKPTTYKHWGAGEQVDFWKYVMLENQWSDKQTGIKNQNVLLKL